MKTLCSSTKWGKIKKYNSVGEAVVTWSCSYTAIESLNWHTFVEKKSEILVKQTFINISGHWQQGIYPLHICINLKTYLPALFIILKIWKQ